MLFIPFNGMKIVACGKNNLMFLGTVLAIYKQAVKWFIRPFSLDNIVCIKMYSDFVSTPNGVKP